jgi:hypothetical protein
MSDVYYCQYAFAKPQCLAQEIGPGVDPQFCVELIEDGPIAAVASRVDLAEFSPDRLQGKTAEDIQWLGKVAARHNEVISLSARSSPVLPLRLGTLFCSLDSLRATLVRCRAVAAEFLDQLGDRQEWGVKLYLQNRRLESAPRHDGPAAPHFSRPQSGGAAYLAKKRAEIDSRREQRAGVYQTVRTVEQCLAGKAENCCRIRNLSSDLTGRSEEMVFNAAFLLSASEQAAWLETTQTIDQNVHNNGLLLEISGPWPPYHFCPNLEL